MTLDELLRAIQDNNLRRAKRLVATNEYPFERSQITIEGELEQLTAAKSLITNYKDRIIEDIAVAKKNVEESISDVSIICCLDTESAIIARVPNDNDSSVDFRTYIESEVPEKVGSTTNRFSLTRKHMHDTYLQQVAEAIADEFEALENEKPYQNGLVLSGPGFTKEDVVEKGYLPSEIEKYFLADVVGTNKTGREGVAETIEKSSYFNND